MRKTERVLINVAKTGVTGLGCVLRTYFLDMLSMRDILVSVLLF